MYRVSQLMISTSRLIILASRLFCDSSSLLNGSNLTFSVAICFDLSTAEHWVFSFLHHKSQKISVGASLKKKEERVTVPYKDREKDV